MVRLLNGEGNVGDWATFITGHGQAIMRRRQTVCGLVDTTIPARARLAITSYVPNQLCHTRPVILFQASNLQPRIWMNKHNRSSKHPYLVHLFC